MNLPSRFGKYLLLERLHAAPFAEVFLAKTGLEGMERVVALKRIQPSEEEEAEVLAAFLDEARISLLLNHASIVHVNEVAEEGGAYFVAMEYVSGLSLAAVLARARELHQPLDQDQAAFIASRIAEGLDSAHRLTDATGAPLGIVHRGVSPQNVLLSWNGEVKLIDFGLAKAASTLRKTQVGVLKGKAGYMSPEQVRGEQVDARSDLFSLGVLLFEMLTAERAFAAPSEFELLQKLSSGQLPPPTTVNPFLPDALEAVVMKACAPLPGARYSSAGELNRDLLRWVLTGDQPYSAPVLAEWMGQLFAQERVAEQARLLRAAQTRPPAAGPPRSRTGTGPAPARPAAGPPPPPTRLRTGQVPARTPSGPVGAPLPPSPQPGTRSQPAPRGAVSLPRLDAPSFSFSEDEEEPAPEERTQVVNVGRVLGAGPPPPADPSGPLPWDEDATRSERQGLVVPPGALASAPPPAEDLPAEGPVPPPRAAARWPLGAAVPAVAAGLLLLLLGGAGLVWWGGQDRVEVMVRVTPAVDAQVTVGGRLIASNTVSEFPPGKYDLVVIAPGFRRHSQQVAIFETAGPAVFSVFLEAEGEPEPPPPPVQEPRTFSVRFDLPPGAEVRVDGQSWGEQHQRSGLELQRVYRYEVHRPGFQPASGEFTSRTPGEQLRLPITLEALEEEVARTRERPPPKRPPPSRPVGFLVYTGEPEGAALWVNGRPTGRVTPVLPDNPLALPVGKHKVQLQLAGLSSVVKAVEIRRGAVYVLKNLSLDTQDDL